MINPFHILQALFETAVLAAVLTVLLFVAVGLAFVWDVVVSFLQFLYKRFRK